MSFNSILVQLEDRDVQHSFPFFSQFQFHIGAIRRALFSSSSETIQKFQFHIGAIRSCVTSLMEPLNARFQFHIGAIRSCYAQCHKGYLHSFQFHIGAIRSGMPMAAYRDIIPGFNSILVQLEVHPSTI